MRSGLDQIEKPFPGHNEIRALFKNVSHARAEHTLPRVAFLCLFVPSHWLFPVMIREETAVRAFVPQFVTHSSRPRVGVAVITCGGNPCATPPGIKGVMGPFDWGVFRHKS